MDADDIVTRLRKPGLCGWATQKQAADEIERLRELVADYKKLIRLRVELRAAVGDEW